MTLNGLLNVKKGITSVIGGGGKTAMLKTLGRELCSSGRVIITTTTHMLPFKDVKCIFSPGMEDIKNALSEYGCVQAGTLCENGKLRGTFFRPEELIKMADYVLCEADGSRGLPIKAHLSHEPVIPESSALIVEVIGANAFLKPIYQACHRPDRFCELSGASGGDVITAENTAAVLMAEKLSDIIFVNQAESPERVDFAQALGRLIDRPLFFGSLRNGVWTCLQ